MTRHRSPTLSIADYVQTWVCAFGIVILVGLYVAYSPATCPVYELNHETATTDTLIIKPK